MSDKMTAKQAIEELEDYRETLMDCPSDSIIDTGCMLAKAMELFIKMEQANGILDNHEQALPIQHV